MKLVWSEDASQEYLDWQQNDPTKLNRINKLIEAIQQNPFTGIGKPERLKHELSGCWSRRIDRTHRLVYTVVDETIIIIQCRYHY